MTVHFAANKVVPNEVIVDLHYLPCLEYFTCFLDYEKLILEVQEFFPKQTYRNRCYVQTANKVDVLTVPIRKASKKGLIRDVQIDYSQDWIKRHWGCLQSAYGKSPFYEYYSAELEVMYQRKPAYLIDLNFELLTLCLKFLGIKKPIAYTLSCQAEVKNTQFDARSLISDKIVPKNSTFYKSIPYYQTFGNDFVSNLSIVDLLFNKGPEARQILTESMASRQWPD